ncbi:DUF58 domain-containing protein [Leifsonia sp. Le1]|uniref:DUF58 domain-containing protein n=1 Tax=Leifsonia sp. Le1 TaxID=3404918 RepID=UPI003EBB99BA
MTAEEPGRPPQAPATPTTAATPAASATEAATASTAATATTASTPWDLSPAVVAALVVALVCLGAGFIASRVELALVGVPLLIAAAYGWDRRPGDRIPLAFSASVEPARDGSTGRSPAAPASSTSPSIPTTETTAPTRTTQGAIVRAIGSVTTPTSTTPTRIDAVGVRIALPNRAPLDTVLTPRAATRIPADIVVVHSGPQLLLQLTVRVIGADASFVGDTAPAPALDRVVRPRVVPVRSLPLPARLIGLTGPHPSARPGDGGEFRDVDRFQPGDRLRRIDWKATARRAQSAGELFVRRTMATSDAAVQFVIDSRDDLTGRVADWAAMHPLPGVSSQDLAREAVVSLAGAYVAAGDRVGFDDLADPARAIPPRAGARHLHRVTRAVELTGPRGAVTERVRAPILAPGALVYVMSTFLDEQPLRLALVWRAAGHRVIAVDVLPGRLTRDLPPRERLALKVVEVERALRFRRLAAAGIDVLAWQDTDDDGAESGTRDARLRELSRPRRSR